MANRIYTGTVGLPIKIDMDEPIGAAENYSLKVKKPNGLFAVWIPFIGSTTEFYYYTVAGDLATPGTYTIQPQLKLGTWEGLGASVKLRVSRAYL